MMAKNTASMHRGFRSKEGFLWCMRAVHGGGNDRFCARLKTDISASNSGLRGRTRSCLTFLERSHRDESKMVRHDLR
jgi:hypothetical protein